MIRFRVFFNTDFGGRTPGYRETMTAKNIIELRQRIANDPFYKNFGGIERINRLF